ncbi:hypothetical protein H2248_001426 [Termitomyces sp. 'cryptogamus']|nr:hypothetical protein H2248_001426 [Termitomyces sp. 'cryptogamus']
MVASDVFQAVAAISLGDHWHLIACGSSSTQPTIYVWEKVDYSFDDRPVMSMTFAPQTQTSASQKVLHTLLVWFLHSLPIILLSTHLFWMPYFWQFLGEVGGGLSHATEALIKLSNQMQDLLLGASSLAVSVTSIKEMTSSTLQLTLTSISVSASLPTLPSVI